MSTASSAASSAAVCGTKSNKDATPLWHYFTPVTKTVGGGRNSSFTCNLCAKKITGTYSRAHAHLLAIKGKGVSKCEKVDSALMLLIKKEIDEAAMRVKESSSKEVPLACQRQGSQGGSSNHLLSETQPFEPRKRKPEGNFAIEAAWNNQAREELRQEIARMFYSAGLPFHLARNPHYVKAFVMASNLRGGSFKPPGYNALRTTLLEMEVTNVQRLTESIKKQWPKKGVSIVNDGWSDPQRRPLINFIAVNEAGPMFLRAVNCEGEFKDKHFIANLIKETISEVGPEYVVQVITDNAPVCQAAGYIIEEMYPKIFWTPCVVHTLNLALKNICAPKDTLANAATYGECSWISDIAREATLIKVFITTHGMRLHMYNQFVKLKMLSIADTRFASVLIMLKRFRDIKEGLQSLVICEKWSLYKEDNPDRAQFVKEKVLEDTWWDKVEYILAFTQPIYDMLRFTDTDQPCLHLVYDLWDTMIEKVKNVIYRHERLLSTEESTFYEVVHDILVSRWSKSSTPLHCLAHSLNPRYYSDVWLSVGVGRVEPHKDLEITTERKKCLVRYFPNMEERRAANVEFGMFSSCEGPFADYESMFDRGVLEPKIWWSVHGTSAPKLQSIAQKLLGQPSSSSCSERNWSTYSFINSIKRNKLTPKRAEDLVYVHSNLRLLSRNSAQYKEGAHRMWDVGGDAYDSFEVDGVGVLEVANLSLDEPEMEWMFLGDDDTTE